MRERLPIIALLLGVWGCGSDAAAPTRLAGPYLGPDAGGADVNRGGKTDQVGPSDPADEDDVDAGAGADMDADDAMAAQDSATMDASDARPAADAGRDSGARPDAGSSCAAAAVHRAKAQRFSQSDTGLCSIPLPANKLSASVNSTDYANAALCGACIAVAGPTGRALVPIVDRCSSCAAGQIGLSDQAFAAVLGPSSSSGEVTWTIAPCESQDPIVYRFHARTSASWTAIQVRNARYPIAKFEFKAATGAYVPFTRADYNYFVGNSGTTGPFALRVTDVHGHVLEDKGIVMKPDVDVPGHAQFPSCSP